LGSNEPEDPVLNQTPRKALVFEYSGGGVVQVYREESIAACKRDGRVQDMSWGGKKKRKVILSSHRGKERSRRKMDGADMKRLP